MITITQALSVFKHEVLRFPGGETHVTIKRPLYEMPVHIRADIYNAEDIMELLMVTDAIRRYGVSDLRLILPYVPYARQDRVANPGEALSVKVFCDLINSQNYTMVSVWDAHSPVTLALLNNVVEVPQHEFVKQLKPVQGTILVAPDAGALKKVFKCAQELGDLQVIRADKTRDTKTGQVTGTVVNHGRVGGAPLLIVDDICDGGRTFIELAKALRPLTRGKISLYVTHGIFSQGLLPFVGLIDQIYCPNVFPGVHDHLATLTVGRSPYTILKRI